MRRLINPETGEVVTTRPNDWVWSVNETGAFIVLDFPDEKEKHGFDDLESVELDGNWSAGGVVTVSWAEMGLIASG